MSGTSRSAPTSSVWVATMTKCSSSSQSRPTPMSCLISSLLSAASAGRILPVASKTRHSFSELLRVSAASRAVLGSLQYKIAAVGLSLAASCSWKIAAIFFPRRRGLFFASVMSRTSRVFWALIRLRSTSLSRSSSSRRNTSSWDGMPGSDSWVADTATMRANRRPLGSISLTSPISDIREMVSRRGPIR